MYTIYNRSMGIRHWSVATVEILRIFSGISHGAALAQAAALKFQLQQPVSRALEGIMEGKS